MSPRLILPLTCAATLAAGWLAGYAKNGGGGAESGAVPPVRPAVRGDPRHFYPASTEAAQQRAAPIQPALGETSELRRTQARYAAVEKMSPDEVADAIAQYSPATASDRETVLPMLAAKWAETDPQAALQWTRTIAPVGSVGSARREATQAVLDVWADADRPAAMAWARALPTGEERSNVLRELVAIIARSDPGAALEFLATLPPNESDLGAYFVFGKWAGQDPVAAAAAALSLPAGNGRQSAIAATLNLWIQADPRAATEWGIQLPDSERRRELLTRAYSTWSRMDLPAAISAVLALPPSGLRNQALYGVVINIDYLDVPTGVRLIGQMPVGEPRKTLLEDAATRWGSREPQAAADAIAALLPGDVQNKMLNRFVSSWANSDPRAALAWLDQLPPEVQTGEAQRMAVERLAAEVPQEALAHVRQIRDETQRSSALAGVISVIARSDPHQASTLVAELPTASQGFAAWTVAGHWAQQEPAAAAAWAVKLSEGEVRDMSGMARPGFSGEWDFPNGEVRYPAVASVVSQWTGRDPAQAAEWIERLPAGRTRDAAVSGLIRHASQSDPEGAAAWADTVQDPKIRAREFDRIARQWLRTDRAAAVRWIEQSPAFSPEMKRLLLPQE